MYNQKLSSLFLRPMQPCDVTAMQRIQLACYGAALIETAAVMQTRAAHPLSVSWVALAANKPNQIEAYLVAYRSQCGRITGLNAPFASTNPADDAMVRASARGEPKFDTLYLHDLAVHPGAAGQGLGQQLVAKVCAVAQQQALCYAALVAVQDAHSFWSRRGFKAHTLQDPQQLASLAAYGAGAQYMLRLLGHNS